MATRKTGRRRRIHGAAPALLLVLLASQISASADPWIAHVRIPRGYSVAQQHDLGGGVWHLAFTSGRPDEVVHVGLIERGSPHRLRTMLSNGRIAGPQPRTERTSEMCRRMRCLLAVNGDFFTDAGMPVGGLIDESRPLRSPIASRPQFSIARNGALHIGSLGFVTSLTTYHPRFSGLLRSGVSAEPRTTAVHGVNVTRAADRIVLYTPHFGPTTETSGGIELIARVKAPAGHLRTGQTTIELISSRSGGSSIPSDGVVLSGHGQGAATLAALWQEVTNGKAERRAVLQVTASPDAVQSVAGRPVLVRNGERATDSESVRDSRTMIGWNGRGDLLLVTVDGKQPGRSVGMSVIEGANLMRAFGVVDALNLDGGGSTTFVLRGRVLNRPSTSSHRERAVAVGVAIVPAA